MYSNKLFHSRIYIKALRLAPLSKLCPLTAHVEIRDTEEFPDENCPKLRDDAGILIATAEKTVLEIVSQKIFWGKFRFLSVSSVVVLAVRGDDNKQLSN